MHQKLALFVSLTITGIVNAGELSVVAGNGSTLNNGDTGVAVETATKDTFGVEFGPDGALYITEVGHHRIRRLDLAKGKISTVVGNAQQGYDRTNALATEASLNEPYEVRFDKAGNMYFVEMQNHVIRRVDARTKRITTIAGTGKPGFSGDGGPATKATFFRPHSIALDGSGNLYVADIGNHRIRRIDPTTGQITTIAGNGTKQLPIDGQMAKNNPMLGPRALYVKDQTLWIALREGNSVWTLSLRSGILRHIAGSGEKGLVDGDPREARFNGPKGIAVDQENHAYVVDTENHVIRRIDATTHQVSTIAGTGKAGSKVGQARFAEMNRPHGICIGPKGSIFVGDTLNHRVVRISQ